MFEKKGMDGCCLPGQTMANTMQHLLSVLPQLQNSALYGVAVCQILWQTEVVLCHSSGHCNTKFLKGEDAVIWIACIGFGLPFFPIPSFLARM